MGFLIPALPLISTIAGIGAGVVGAVGAEESGAAQKAAATYQAQVAENNAKAAKQNADWEMQAGDIAAGNKGMETRFTVGAEKAIQGASGIDVNSGSALETRVGTAMKGMTDVGTIESNAAKRAHGYQVAGVSDTAEAGLLKQEGEQAAIAGNIGAMSSLLGAASSVSSNWASWQRYQNPTGG